MPPTTGIPPTYTFKVIVTATFSSTDTVKHCAKSIHYKY